MPPNPSLHRKRYSGLRPLPRSGELKRWAECKIEPLLAPVAAAPIHGGLRIHSANYAESNHCYPSPREHRVGSPSMYSRLRAISLALALLATASSSPMGAELKPWDASFDSATGKRFLPIELWTGGDWDGLHLLRMTPAKLYFGKRNEKSIVGPIQWIRPSSGESLQVYERQNKGKKQLFALSSRGDGLGRVYDSRYGRDCKDEVKFPLGYWSDGETRTFDVSCNDGNLIRKITLTITKIDFVYEGVPHSLEFHWLVGDGKEPGTDMHYTYSPGKGLVSLDAD